MPDGSKLLVEGEAQDIVRRLTEGDASIGWEGDPNMRVTIVVDPNDVNYGKFEVWTLDAQGTPYLACVSPTCGPELVKRIMDNDPQRFAVIENLINKQKKAHADRDERMKEHYRELADKLHFALIRENGQHFGGLTKRIYSMS